MTNKRRYMVIQRVLRVLRIIFAGNLVELFMDLNANKHVHTGCQ